MTGARFRSVALRRTAVSLERGARGAMYLRSTATIGPYPARLTDRLVKWAREAPDRRSSPAAMRRASGATSRTATRSTLRDGSGRRCSTAA